MLHHSSVTPVRSRQPACDCRIGAALGDGTAGAEAGRRGVGTRSAKATDPRRSRRGNAGGAPGGRTTGPRVVAYRAIFTGTKEGAPAVSDRQGRSASQRS